jgi:outer membrane protein assembly factor BamB
MRKNRVLWQWSLSIAFVIFWTWLWFRPPSQVPRPPRISSHHSSMPSLWVRTDYFIDSNNDAQMVALKNKLFFIGSAPDKELRRLIAVDSSTGDILWQYGGATVRVLTASDNKLFVGELGGGRVVALNADTGAVEWSTNGRIGNVTSLLIRKNVLYVDTINEYYLLDADTGNLLKTIPYTLGKAPNPEIPIWSNHRMNLQFVGNVTYFQRQTVFPIQMGEIIASDEVSGKQLWDSGSFYAASRIAESPLGVFVLDSDGMLLRFDPINGRKDQVIQFSPEPNLNNNDGWFYGYHIAIDSDNHLLFVYFGDSGQLFAYNVQ